MALGRNRRFPAVVEPRAPRVGPQSFVTGLLRGDVLGFTRSHRAAELAAFPGTLSRTYYGEKRPPSAVRLPPVIDAGDAIYGGDYFNRERVRETLVARARYARGVTGARGTGRG